MSVKHSLTDRPAGPPKKEDRRITRTRQLLRDSLMTLILEHGYDSVTVQDITDHANLGRATFYLHYKDKEELFLKSLEETFNELLEQAGPPLLPNEAGNRPPPVERAFQYAAANRALFLVMLRSNAASSVERRIRGYVSAVTRDMVNQVGITEALPVPVEVFAEHCAGSLLALLRWWLDQEMPYPPERMAEMFRTLNIGWLVS